MQVLGLWGEPIETLEDLCKLQTQRLLLLDPPKTAEVLVSVFCDTGRESEERGNEETAESGQLAGPEEDEYGGSTDEEQESTLPTPAEPRPGTVLFLMLCMGVSIRS